MPSRTVVLAVAVAAVVFGLHQLVVSGPWSGQIADLATRVETLDQSLTETLAAEKDGESRLAALQAEVARLERLLPPEGEVEAFASELRRRTEAAGLLVEELGVGATELDDGFRRTVVSIRLSGGDEGLLELLHQLEEGPGPLRRLLTFDIDRSVRPTRLEMSLEVFGATTSPSPPEDPG